MKEKENKWGTMEENVQAFATMFGEEAERIIRDNITVHNWPYGRPNRIFSVGENPIIRDNIFSATVKGVSYLGTIDDFNMEYLSGSDEFEREIPLGYTTLDLYERSCIFEEGKKIWENTCSVALKEIPEEELKRRKLDLYVLKEQEHYAIFLPERIFDGKFCVCMGNLKYPTYAMVNSSSFPEVCSLAKQFSNMHHVPCLVAKLVYSCNWH